MWIVWMCMCYMCLVIETLEILIFFFFFFWYFKSMGLFNRRGMYIRTRMWWNIIFWNKNRRSKKTHRSYCAATRLYNNKRANRNFCLLFKLSLATKEWEIVFIFRHWFFGCIKTLSYYTPSLLHPTFFHSNVHYKHHLWWMPHVEMCVHFYLDITLNPVNEIHAGSKLSE